MSESNNQLSGNIPLNVFISYARESEDVIKQILSFADYLRPFGINPILDEIENDRHSSVNFENFMKDGPLSADKVVVVLSERFKERADQNIGGVGTECSVFASDYESNPDRYVFISICEGNKSVEEELITPAIFKGVAVHSLNANTESWEEMLRRIYNEPKFKLNDIGEKIDFKQEAVPSFFELIQEKRYKNYDFSNILFHSILTVEKNDEDFSYEAYRCIVVSAIRLPEFKMTPQFEYRSPVKLSSRLVSLPDSVEMDDENCVVFSYPIPKNNKRGDVIPMHYRLDLSAPKGTVRNWSMHSENDSQVEIHDIVTNYQVTAPNAKLYKRRIYSSVEIFVEDVPFNPETKTYRVVLFHPKAEYTYLIRW